MKLDASRDIIFMYRDDLHIGIAEEGCCLLLESAQFVAIHCYPELQYNNAVYWHPPAEATCEAQPASEVVR